MVLIVRNKIAAGSVPDTYIYIFHNNSLRIFMRRKIFFNRKFVKKQPFCAHRIRVKSQSDAIIILHRMQVYFQKRPCPSPLNLKRLYIIK